MCVCVWGGGGGIRMRGGGEKWGVGACRRWETGWGSWSGVGDGV